jgi:DNA-binding FrmR family transcriptional regulator
MRARGPHPDAREIAEHQAGARTGLAFWRARRVTAHLDSCRRCQQVAGQLSSVTTALASAPVPTMPTNVAERVSAALSAEQAARTADAGAAGGDRARHPVAKPATGRLPLLRRAVYVPVAVVVVLVALIGGGALLRHTGPGGASSSGAQSPELRTNTGTRAGPEANGTNPDTKTPSYRVVSTGQDYHAATLGAQAAALLRTGASMIGRVGTHVMSGCVSQVAGQAAADVRVVDQARYQGSSALIIVSPARVWVVGHYCSAAHPGLLASAAVPGHTLHP